MNESPRESTAHRKSEASIYSVDVSPLFAEFGVRQTIEAVFTDKTYEYEELPADNWLHAAFHGFQKLRWRRAERNQSCDTFASIGTGPGLDCIGAAHIFHAKTVIGIDLEEEITEVAERNMRTNCPADTRIVTATGDLTSPLREREQKVDIAYANLPLLPEESDAEDSPMSSSTFMSRELFERAPEIYRKTRLAMIHAFLTDVRSSLKDDGCAVVNLGGRVHFYPHIYQLFRDCRYDVECLFSCWKVQTQAEEVLAGFSKAEQEEGIEFDFCRTDNLDDVLIWPDDTSPTRAFPLYRVSATEALELSRQGVQIGHIVHVLAGSPIREES